MKKKFKLWVSYAIEIEAESEDKAKELASDINLTDSYCIDTFSIDAIRELP
jgi:hypothetical protein